MQVDEIIAQSSFSMLKGKVDDRILNAVKGMGFEKPTRVQAECMPYLLMQKDLVGAAKTGSGKTLAFLIPVINYLLKLEITPKHGTGCIILSPTRELALQTYDVLQKLLAKIKLTYCLVVGGEKKHKEVSNFEKGVNIVVCTPGRLLDHLQNTTVFYYKNMKCLVLDEVDKLLENGFKKAITSIIELIPKNRQTIMFSATVNDQVENIARLAMRSEPVYVIIKDDTQSTNTGLQQGYCICPIELRLQWLIRTLKKCKNKKAIVFFSSCKSVDFHCAVLKKFGYTVTSLHGRLSQTKRKEAYHSFVEAKEGLLVCTDIAARGLDIPAVDWIVQYDPPSDPKEYIHRVGRTARGENATGNAVILLTPQEEAFIGYLKQEKVHLDKYNFQEPPMQLVEEFIKMVENDGVLKGLARIAYLKFLLAYKSHPMRTIFNVKTLDLKATSRAFGFSEPPDVDFMNAQKKKKR